MRMVFEIVGAFAIFLVVLVGITVIVNRLTEDKKDEGGVKKETK